MRDRAGVRPLCNVRFQPRHRVLAQSPSLRKPSSELKAVNRHSRKPGELHHLTNTKEFHRDTPQTSFREPPASWTSWRSTSHRVTSEMTPLRVLQVGLLFRDRLILPETSKRA